MEEKDNTFLKTVLGLYSKYGIKSVTMDDVARELGISKKTLYTFVADKNELVEKVIDFQCKLRQEWMNGLNLDELPALQEVAEVGKMISKMISDFNPSFEYDLAKYYGKIYKKMMGLNQEAMSKSMRRNLEKGKAEGFYRQEINEEIIVPMQIANTQNLANIGFYSSLNYPPEEIQKQLFNYHIHALLTQEGVVEYNRILNTDQS